MDKDNRIDISTTPDHYSVFEIVNEETKSEKRPGVLCTVKGIFMVANKVNENNRKYTTELFDKAILGYDYTKQMLEAKTLFGEAAHPEERFEVYIPLVSHCVTALWREGDTLYGKADVLDTPSGKIIDTMVRYGSKIGISARARGQLITDKDGVIHPDEDMYLFKTFDFVCNPGFAEARMSKVNESVGETTTMLEELEKIVESASEDTLRQIKPIFESAESLQPLLVKINEKLSKKTVSVDKEDEYDYNSVMCEMYEELDTLQDKIDSLQAIIVKKNKAINEQKSVIATLQHNLVVLNEHVQSCVGIKQQAIDLYTGADKDYQSVVAQLNEARAELDDANDTIVTLGDVCEQYEEQINDLSVQLNEAKVVANRLSNLDEAKQEKKKVVKVNHTHPVPKSRKQDFLNEGLVSGKQEDVYDLNEQSDRQKVTSNKLARFIQGC